MAHNKTLHHLFVVCCHGIWLGGPTGGKDENEWLIAPFQKGETPGFIEHLKAGLRALEEDDRAVLMLSGGPTRKETPLSEAQSYLNVALANNFWSDTPATNPPTPSPLLSRIHLESRALDSYHNLLFSLTLYLALFSQPPSHLTIISHQFKCSRFLDLHIPALHWPLAKATYIGIDPDYFWEVNEEGEERAVEVRQLERVRGYRPWELDREGRGVFLSGKREERNCWGVGQGLFENEESRGKAGVEVEVVDGMEVVKGAWPWEVEVEAKADPEAEVVGEGGEAGKSQ